MQGNLDPVQAKAADDRAAKVESIMKDLEQAGRGLSKVFGQVATGVPQGNEVHYLIIVQGRINAAMHDLSELAVPAAAPEGSAPQIALG